MNDPKDFCPDRSDEETVAWTDEDFDEYDDYLQSKEDLEQEEG